MQMDDVVARLLELENTVQELRRTVEGLEELLTTGVEDRRTHALGYDEDRDRGDEVAALRALNKTLAAKLDAIKNLEPARTVATVEGRVGTALTELYAALAAPDWENPLNTPGAQPPAPEPGRGDDVLRAAAPDAEPLRQKEVLS